MLARMAESTLGAAHGIIVAAGRSERMDGADKVFAPLMGRPLIVWSLGAFRACESVERVVVVAAEPAVAQVRTLIDEWRFSSMATVVAGGTRRRDSVRAGVDAAEGAAFVAVHDAARPLVKPALIDRVVALARESGAAICAMPAIDSVKEVDGDPPRVRATHDRARIWLAQTPQAFRRDLLLRAHDADDGDATDDAALVEALRHEVRVCEGAPWNLKVTTPADLTVAETLLRERYREPEP
jgi:2-C-methyl-D-erythritol 4-phosphate cytidylyltransferase